MKKIGLIDLHIDEWHANNYPAWFHAAPSGKDFIIGGAWEESPAPNGKPLDAWSESNQIPAYHKLEKLIEECDCFCILAPSNPEAHERLAELPLRSGKDVFIDKPFAPNRTTAERMFALADSSGSRLFSSSALRFGNELTALRGTFEVDFMSTRGGGSSFWEYAIHQLEMLISVMGTNLKALTHYVNDGINHVVLEYADGRHGTLTRQLQTPFGGFLTGKDKFAEISGVTAMFPNMLESMLHFFNGGKIPVDRQETIIIAHVLDCAIHAKRSPGKRIAL